MTRRYALIMLSGLLIQPTMPAVDTGDMSGKWKLNIEKSKWGEKHRPQSVEIEIQHREPALKYTGIVTDASGVTTKFHFEGAIDNKEYQIVDGGVQRTARVRRISPLTTSTTIKSPDGKITENATTTISQDGKTLTRNIMLKTPEGTTKWTEVYDRVE
jgi:hypothetical protein